MSGQMSRQAAGRLRGRETARDLGEFICESPSAFHTVSAIRRRLDTAAFAYLPENTDWTGSIEPGRSYYTVRNNSSIIAWRVGDQLDSYHFQMAAAHGDSPTFKLKHNPEHKDAEGYVHLDVEAYGGTIDYTWFDRPLSIAGRVLVRTGMCVSSRLVALDSDMAIIPSLAYHLDRNVNDGFSPSRVTDVSPIISAGEAEEGGLRERLADVLNVEADQILAHDLYLVNRQKPTIWGKSNELISAPRLDDLMCAFAALRGFLSSRNEHCITVYACFDNEEVGSGTKQGARSTFMSDVLARVNAALGKDDADLLRALAGSMLVSCDNVHAAHPAHPELSDASNHPRLNGGIVVKEAANQRYCTDGFSRAVFCDALDRAGVPHQTFSNRSDMPGGATLGNLLTGQVSVHAVDVGCAQLAMHSAFETAGTYDVDAAARALEAFYSEDIQISGADAALLR